MVEGLYPLQEEIIKALLITHCSHGPAKSSTPSSGTEPYQLRISLDDELLIAYVELGSNTKNIELVTDVYVTGIDLRNSNHGTCW